MKVHIIDMPPHQSEEHDEKSIVRHIEERIEKRDRARALKAQKELEAQ